MKSYTTRDVARLLGLSEAQVRSHARCGVLTPDRGPRNAYRFSFQDLVLLRAAKALRQARIGPRRIRRALRSLARQLPAGRSLSGVRITSEGDRIVVRDGGDAWHPESGQLLLDFRVAELTGDRAPLLDPRHVSARVNLGRWLQQDGHPAEAADQYRVALAAQPRNPTAAFNLGTALEELGRRPEAIAAYRSALAADGDFADAHFNLARLYEQTGNRVAALRHLKAYKRLSE